VDCKNTLWEPSTSKGDVSMIVIFQLLSFTQSYDPSTSNTVCIQTLCAILFFQNTWIKKIVLYKCFCGCFYNWLAIFTTPAHNNYTLCCSKLSRFCGCINYKELLAFDSCISLHNSSNIFCDSQKHSQKMHKNIQSL